jgi:hypothetical protein
MSPERAKQQKNEAASPFQGLCFRHPDPGFGCFAAFTLGFAASRFQR